MDQRTRNGTLWAAAGLGALAAVSLARRLNRYNLRDKTVLITGGSRGLGLALAREFHKAGSNLVICARDAEELERARYELAHAGAQVLAVPCDVTNPDDIALLIDAAHRRFGRVDVLVNNAGVIQVGPIEEQTLADYEEAMQVHFWGPLRLIQAVLPEMRRQREGRIVNISSIGGKISFPHLIPYSASKFALVGLSEGLRSELAEDGIVVTTVCPGLMRTGSPRNAYFKGRHQEEYTWFTLADSAPGVTASAGHAAREIVNACRYGKAEVSFPWPAQLAILTHGIWPGVVQDVLGAVNRRLPEPDGIGKERVPGRESETDLTRSWLTRLTQVAARDLNELGQ